MLKIFHVASTRSVRPIWLCYELNLPFKIEPIDFSPTFRNSSEWRAISPAGKVPALIDGDVTMFESGAMVEFILDRYGEGRLRPIPGTAAYATHQQWCWFAEATLSRPLGLHRLMASAKEGDQSVAVVGEQKARTGLDAVELALSDSKFLLGDDFNAADIMMGYSLELFFQLGVLDDQYPNAQVYLEKLKTRDACKRAMNA